MATSCAADTFMLHENFGGSWVDAEKTPSNTEDDNMCWAAAASNVLAWTKWGWNDADTNFAYFQDHWTDQGGLMNYAWEWWIDGTNRTQGWEDWSQVDVPGGGFWPNINYSDLYHHHSSYLSAMPKIDEYLRAGYGTALTLKGSHAITVWGFEEDYSGIYLTDSDDYKNHPVPPDMLRYYDINLEDGKWFLQDYFGSDSWYISGVYGLERRVLLEGDANRDGIVDTLDFTIFKSQFGMKGMGLSADFDNDYDVDLRDFVLLRENFEITPSQMAIPELYTIIFLLIIFPFMLYKRPKTCP